MSPHLQYRIIDDVYQSIPRMYDDCLLNLMSEYSNSVRKKYKNKKVQYSDKYKIKRTAKITDTTCSRYGIIITVQYETLGIHKDSIYLCDAILL